MRPDLPPEFTTPTGSFEVEFEVPDDLLSLGAEMDDPDAAAEHEAFLDARLAENAPAEVRRQALAQLADVRARLIDNRVHYLAVASAELDGRWVFCLFAVTLAGFAPSPEFAPSHILAASLRHYYGEDWCLVEEFETDHAPAVGVRRCDMLTIPAEAYDSGQARQIDTGAAQAIVIFGELEVTGVVSGYCLDVEDIDLTATLVGVIAHSLRITAAEPSVP